MKTYILYTTDAWLSYSSRDIIAVCSTLKNAVKLAKQHSKDNDNCLNAYEVSFLLEKYQTQGRELNYCIEEVDKNTLI